MTRTFSRRSLFRLLAGLALLYAVLLIPDCSERDIQRASDKPFAWNKDDLWAQLEQRFQRAQAMAPSVVDAQVMSHAENAEKLLSKLQSAAVGPADPVFGQLEEEFFTAAPLVAAGTTQRGWFIDFYNRVRVAVKRQSRSWDMASKPARNTLYRVLYGMRAAVEEVLLQARNAPFQPAMLVTDEPSAAPSAQIFGITVHSGDLLVSRGGAEVSALISRGNDFPGNFSHVALVYVDERSRTAHIVESHIESGVAVSSIEQYVRDPKLRFMVLRPRANLPQLMRDPLLPQKAAKFVFDEGRRRHIPYDFKMNFHDPAAMFCSEVGSYAYGQHGIRLWQSVSTISSQGVVNWLHAFGVENFVTQMPSDLEYDPQLAIVAEWRGPQTLLKDHIDNAVMDVLLEGAEAGQELRYEFWELPIARATKGYCVALNLLGKECLIPEGMSATQALKSRSFVERHAALRRRTEQLVAEFVGESGYVPPYWKMVKLARDADEQRR